MELYKAKELMKVTALYYEMLLDSNFSHTYQFNKCLFRTLVSIYWAQCWCWDIKRNRT